MLGVASERLKNIIKRMNNISKAQQVFVTDIGGKTVNWNMIFQFNLDNEEPFYLAIENQKVDLKPGTAHLKRAKL